MNQCVDCGVEINRRSIRCNPCAHKGEHNPNWRGGDEGFREGREKIKGKVIITGDWHTSLEGAYDTQVIVDLACNEWKGKPVLLLGDLMDAGLDKGMNFENKSNPGDQILEVKRITDMLDVRAYVLGNHEDRIFKKIGMNPYETFLGKPRNQITIDYVKFFLHHGRTAAHDIFKEHEKLMLYASADVFCLGHNHQLAKKDVMRDRARITLLRTGSFVVHPSYALKMGYPPGMPGYVEYNTEEMMARLYLVSKEGVVEEI